MLRYVIDFPRFTREFFLLISKFFRDFFWPLRNFRTFVADFGISLASKNTFGVYGKFRFSSKISQNIGSDFEKLFFPKTCIFCEKRNTLLCKKCESHCIQFVAEDMCHVCGRPKWLAGAHTSCLPQTLIQNVSTATRYNKHCRQLVGQIKYNGYFSFIDVAAELILKTHSLELFKNSVLVPIPLHPKKLKLRGFNQAELIADKLRQKLISYQINTEKLNLVARTKNTKTQVGMSRQQRLKNLNGAFSINQSELSKFLELKTKNIILIDDVYTTGTTIEKCAEVILNSLETTERKTNARISAITLAKA